MTWQYLLNSHAINEHFRVVKYIDIYCVEYNQEDGIVSNLKEMIYERPVNKKRLRTQRKISVPKLRLCNWENLNELDHDHGWNIQVSYPKIYSLFLRYPMSIMGLFWKVPTGLPHLPKWQLHHDQRSQITSIIIALTIIMNDPHKGHNWCEQLVNIGL